MKRIAALILVFALTLSGSVSGFAFPGENGTGKVFYLEPIIEVNPFYKDVAGDEDFQFEKIQVSGTIPVTTYESSYESVGETVREYLKNRTTTFTVNYKTSDFDGTQEAFNEICRNIFYAGLTHTGNPTEGDYIMWQWDEYGARTSYTSSGGVYSFKITFQVIYYTSAEQEAELDEAIEELLASLNLGGKNDYQKICAIYDYICDNVTYDYQNLYDDTYDLKYTAYAALMNKTAVCQGYSNLFYRLALESGVDARLIPGTGNNEAHGWNIVQMGDYYYNLDSTWDAGKFTYGYFLKCENNFKNHVRKPEYDTPEFHAEYPMGASDYVYKEDDFGKEDIIASGYCGGEGDGTNLEWTIDKDGVLTISGQGKMADYSSVYIWPDYVTSAPWGKYADKLKTLVIEEGVTSIGTRAFYNLSDFSNELIIPNTVTEIRELAFSYCRGFKGDLVIPNGVEIIGRAAFLESDFKGNLVLSDSVREIGESAFAYCDSFNGSLELNDGLEVLGGRAFFQCSFIGNLVIPGSLSIISEYAFANCKNINGSLIIENGVRIIGENAFEGCNGFKGDLVIPDSVTTIGNTAFRACTGFNGELVIGNKVEAIGDGAFIDCDGFKGDILIPESVKSIGGSAFQNCSGFNGKLILTNSINEIRDEAFRNCSGLTGELVIPESITKIEDYTFSNCSGFTGDLIIPENVTQIGYSAFQNCSGFTGDLVIPDSVTTIRHQAFYGCTGFTGNLVIGNSVKTIVASAFRDCYGFTGNLVIPDSVTTIGEYAFDGCNGFTGDLVIGNGVITIGDYAFRFCYGFTGDLVIGNSVTTIGNSAFDGCTGFTGDLVIPDSVTTIGNFAFRYCEGFSGDLVIGNSVTTIGERVFYNCGFNDYYFEGDAPSVYGASSDYLSFDSYDTIHYPAGNETWEIVDGKWNGYNAVEYRLPFDISVDGRVDIKDVYYLRLVAAKLISASAEDIEVADVDGDGKLTAIDANILRKYLAKIITELPKKGA